MIRYVQPGDHAVIDRLLEQAFGKPDEARMVRRLRADGDVLFELAAHTAEGLAGHILFSRLWADRYELFAALAPLAVQPDAQRGGIGARLVQAGLESCREFGVHGVLVLGEPGYYGRFGFSAAAAAQVQAPFAGSPAFQGLALEPEAFGAPLSVAYPDGFAAG